MSPRPPPPEPLSPANLAFVEELYYGWLADPNATPEPWRAWFASLPAAPGSVAAPGPFSPRRGGVEGAAGQAALQLRVEALTRHYLEQGHLRARLDPLELLRPVEPIELDRFGLGPADLDRPVRGADGAARPLREHVARLEETYCRSMGVELNHLTDPALRGWLEEKMERTGNRLTLAPEVKRRLLHEVVRAELLEQFVEIGRAHV